MAVEVDEFANLEEDFQFSPEELEAIDAIENRASDVVVPSLAVQVEPSLSKCPKQVLPSVRIPSPLDTSTPSTTGESSPEVMKIRRLNLLRVFRPLGSLSVTDLVGPQWCEVKFEYTLRWGNRWERVTQKPSHIVTARGKRIAVEKATAQQSEDIMVSGRVSLEVICNQLMELRDPGLNFSIRRVSPCTRSWNVPFSQRKSSCLLS